MTRVRIILAFLGGKRVLSTARRAGEPDFVALVRKGLPATAFRHASEQLQLPAGELTRSLGLARRTVTRRKERLTAAESSRLFRLARIFVRAVQVLDWNTMGID